MPPRSRMKRSQSFDSDIEIISDDSEAELDLALRAPAARPSTSSSTALALYGDGDAYQITGFGQGGLFQRNKRKKLLIQNDQRRTDDLEPGAAPPPQFFRSLAVYINGFTEGARLKQLSELLVRHGGVHIAYLDRKELVTHIVASNLTPSKREGFASYKVATSAWLIDSVAEGKLLDWRKYNLLAAPVLDPNSTALGDEVGKVAQRSLLGMGLGAAPVVISSSPTDSQLQALKIDLDCFHALPLDLQLEHYADRKSRLVTSTKPALRDEQHQRVRDALDVHIVPPPVLKKRATTLEEIRELLELWVESAEGAPDDKDVKVVATFLEKALDRTSGQDMEMVGGILSWLEMLALCTVTRPSKGLFLLSMSNSPDNRLTPDYIKESLMPALDHIELTWRTDFANGDKEAALVITGERDKHKFFSNGLDLAVSQEYMGFFKDYYYPLLARVVTFPIHTVAAINGHCFAGGFLLAQACDTKIVRSERAWQCMNELDFGAPLPPGMASLLNHRLSPAVMRKTMLTAHRWTAPEALAAGFVDESVPGDGEAVITRALEIAESMKKHSTSGNINIDLLSDLRKEESMQAPQDVNELRFQALKAAFERDQKKSKL
ncbi:hypothetical protein RQP46_007136 [Phenoliferia psychrophenolica]